jgi:hypothetical protein
VDRRAGRWRRAEDVVHGAGRAAEEVVDACTVFVVVTVSAGADVARPRRAAGRGGEAALVVGEALHFAAVDGTGGEGPARGARFGGDRRRD